jgi:hypothetical protein
LVPTQAGPGHMQAHENMDDTENIIGLFEDTDDTVTDILAADTQPDTLDQLAARTNAQIALLEAEKARLELESFETRLETGTLKLPDQIVTDWDARVWLAWATANDHQAGCLCARCPEARKRVGYVG